MFYQPASDKCHGCSHFDKGIQLFSMGVKLFFCRKCIPGSFANMVTDTRRHKLENSREIHA